MLPAVGAGRVRHQVARVAGRAALHPLGAGRVEALLRPARMDPLPAEHRERDKRPHRRRAHEHDQARRTVKIALLLTTFPTLLVTLREKGAIILKSLRRSRVHLPCGSGNVDAILCPLVA